MTPDLLLKFDIILNLYFLLLTLYNIRYLNRNSSRFVFDNGTPDHPKVSVILPVRNEEDRVSACLHSLLSQSYDNYEVIAVNDNSTDATPSILAKLASRDPRLLVVNGRALPDGWNGKSYACNQGVEAATGDFLLFTDADTVHGPESIAWALQAIREHDADLVSAYVHQQLGNLGELVLVPVMFIMTALLLPLGLIPRRNASFVSFAIGQFIMCRASSFRSIDAYSRFKGSVVEDISMAREMKRSGYKTIFLDAQGYISCHMYNGFRSAFRGIAKSLFGAINSSLLSLLALTALILFTVVYPFSVALFGVLGGASLLSPFSIPVALFLLTWIAKLHNRHISFFAVLLYPITFACVILVAVYSAAKTGFGAGLDWKGRLVIAEASRERRHEAYRRIVDFAPPYRLAADVVTTVTFLAVYVFAKLAFGLEIVGREQLRFDRGRRRILISNHVLYLDGAMVGCSLFPDRIFFSALEATFSMPFVGRFIRLLGAFPLPERNTLRRIAEPLEQMFSMGWYVHFFPEGELRRLNREPAEFKSGAFFLACVHEALVTPVTLVVLDRPIIGKLVRGAFRVRIVVQDSLDARDYLARYASRTAAARAMACDARERMRGLLGSVESQSPSTRSSA